MKFHRMTVLFLVCLLMLAFIACTDSEKDADGDAPEDGDNAEDGDTPPDGDTDEDGDGEDGEDGDTDSDEETPLPEGCEELLKYSDTPLNCEEYHESRCRYARENPDETYMWQFLLYQRRWGESFSEDEMSHRRQCVKALLERQGVTQPDLLFDTVFAYSATYAQVEPLFHLKGLIEEIVPSCLRESLTPSCQCAGRNREACGESAFCYGFGGEKYDRARACKVGYVAVTCASYIWDQACGDMPITITDTAGNCWWWPHTCYPEVTDWIEEDWADESSEYWGDGWCSDENLHSLPDCEE
jgi:hypothetical protein